MSAIPPSRPAVILLAEDNPADQALTRRALEDARVRNELVIVEDGEQTLDYLMRRGDYADPAKSPRPDILLLDINMPRLDGKEVLRRMKDDPDLAAIPVVMLTTSDHDRDIIESYQMGVNAYVTKPVSIEQFREVIKALQYFWLVMVRLPPNEESERRGREVI